MKLVSHLAVSGLLYFAKRNRCETKPKETVAKRNQTKPNETIAKRNQTEPLQNQAKRDLKQAPRKYVFVTSQ